MLGTYSNSDNNPDNDLRYSKLGANRSSVIALPTSLDVSSAEINLQAGQQLQLGDSIGAAAMIDPNAPSRGLKVEWGTVSQYDDFDQEYEQFYTYQNLPGGNSGTGAWVMKNGQLSLIGNLQGGGDGTSRFIIEQIKPQSY